MKIVFIGAGKYGWYCLRTLLEKNWCIKSIFALDEQLAALKATYVSYANLAKRYDIPLIRVRDINHEDNVNRITELDPDLIIVCSWSQIIKEKILQVPT